MAVHLSGYMADMVRIMELADKYNLSVVEDACQGLGAGMNGKKAGSWGLTGCWSFYPFKILGGYGDGGAITTDDPDVARFAMRMRYNGEDRETGEYHGHGFTCLLDNMQAAFLDVKCAICGGGSKEEKKSPSVTGLLCPIFPTCSFLIMMTREEITSIRTIRFEPGRAMIFRIT